MNGWMEAMVGIPNNRLLRSQLNLPFQFTSWKIGKLRWHRGKDQIKCFAQLWNALEIHLWYQQKLKTNEWQKKDNTLFTFLWLNWIEWRKKLEEPWILTVSKTTRVSGKSIPKENQMADYWSMKASSMTWAFWNSFWTISTCIPNQFSLESISLARSFFLSKTFIKCKVNALDSYKKIQFFTSKWFKLRGQHQLESIFELFSSILNFFLIFRKST